jgi:hypothetical protein
VHCSLIVQEVFTEAGVVDKWKVSWKGDDFDVGPER